MRLLLDTHVVLWWLNADRRLSRSVRQIIAEGDVAVSAATVWEITIKRMLGRITVDLEELISAMRADQFTELPVRFAHSVALQFLPRHHDDPFDRLLIAQAIAEGRRLVTRDRDVLDLYVGIDGFNPLRA